MWVWRAQFVGNVIFSQNWMLGYALLVEKSSSKENGVGKNRAKLEGFLLKLDSFTAVWKFSMKFSMKLESWPELLCFILVNFNFSNFISHFPTSIVLSNFIYSDFMSNFPTPWSFQLHEHQWNVLELESNHWRWTAFPINLFQLRSDLSNLNFYHRLLYPTQNFYFF